MKITILNGDMKQDENDFSRYLEKLAEGFRENHSIYLYPLNKMNLHYRSEEHTSELQSH